MFPESYRIALIVMAIIAVIVYIALQYFKAGYGYLRTANWGPSIPNRPAWVLMECPVFIVMVVLMVKYQANANIVTIAMATLFLIHYFQRSFIFPLLIKGKSIFAISVLFISLCEPEGKSLGYYANALSALVP